MAARHFTITGAVQGVGFRYAMCMQARRLRLAGWVCNRSDGAVEALAAGDPEALDAFAKWARRGPPAARVDTVRVRAATDAEAADAGESFDQRA